MTCWGLAVRFLFEFNVIFDCFLIKMVLSLTLRAPQSFTLQLSPNWQCPHVSMSLMLILCSSSWCNMKHGVAGVQEHVVVGVVGVLNLVLVQKRWRSVAAGEVDILRRDAWEKLDIIKKYAVFVSEQQERYQRLKKCNCVIKTIMFD